LTANNNINKDSTFSGTINGLGGTLVKTGVGSLKLSNKGSQLGNVTVSNGDLNLAHSGALIVSGNYITQNGASTTLSAEPSQLKVNGTFTQADGSTLNATIGATPDISAQNIVLGGVLNINGFNEGKQPVRASEAIGKDYILMSSTNAITGTFTNNVNDTIDYLQLAPGLARSDQDYVLGIRLSWTEGSQALSTGTFTMDEGSAFDVDIALTDQVGTFDNWDGRSLTKAGRGRLVLSAANSYSGGTTINGGILQISQDANLGAASGTVTFNGGTLSTTAAFSSARSLNVQNGGGTLNLQNGDLTLTGSLSGSGDLSKTGVSTLNSQGSSSGYNGTLTVAEGQMNSLTPFGGSLVVTGKGSQLNVDANVTGNLSAANSATLNAGGVIGGNLTVQSGAYLALTGTAPSPLLTQANIPPSISHLASTPSSSLNTLQVVGTVNFASGGIYQVKTDPGNSADHLFTNGSASLAGGKVAVKVGLGDYNRSITYTILTANGGVTNPFDGYFQTFSLLGFKLTYDPNNVYLTVQRNDVSVADVMRAAGGSGNQRSVGSAIDSLGGANRLNQAIVALPDDDNNAAIRDALNQVSGELHASIKAGQIEDSHFIRDAANDRLRAAFNGVGANLGAYDTQGQAVAANSSQRLFWARAFGGWGSVDG
ncbi:autotransporter-associated beta strand repeat-containing protein, partial [Neisseriaceae bacterium TC5R-5]|nr:autotransporter-associated beta strand repeat-containing protein [Neisseriaceae bacterium TC5R-5]